MNDASIIFSVEQEYLVEKYKSKQIPSNFKIIAWDVRAPCNGPILCETHITPKGYGKSQVISIHRFGFMAG
jgi:hypothetical protein